MSALYCRSTLATYRLQRKVVMLNNDVLMKKQCRIKLVFATQRTKPGDVIAIEEETVKS